MSSDDDDGGIPGFIWDLKPLVGSVTFLVALASNPAETLRNAILDVVLGWFLGGAIDLFSGLAGLLLDAGSQLATVPTIIATALLDLGALVGSPAIDLLGALGDILGTIAGLAGPFGPVLAMGFAAILIYIAFETLAITVDTLFPKGGDYIRAVRGLFR